MAKVTLLLLLSVMVTCAVDRTLAMGKYGYYLPGYPAIGGDLLSFGPVLQPDCDKNKESSEGSSGESSGEASKEGGSSNEESKSSLNEGETSSKSEEGGSKEEKKEEGKSEESGGGETEEKKEAPEKKESKENKYVFPSYTFPARQMQQVVYSSGTPYNYMPYRYVVQQPVVSSPLKTNYQYVPLPGSATLSNIYSSPIVNGIPSSSVARIVYSSPTFNYPSVSKTILTPGAQVYSNPVNWNSPVSYYNI